MLGLGAGGMPTDARPGMRPDSGHGVGCAHMLRQGPKPDYAVIAKSGWSVSWEEVGLAWYEVNVAGAHSYVEPRRNARARRRSVVGAGDGVDQIGRAHV